MQKVEVEVENLKKSWIFFFNSVRAVLFSESQKNIYWALLDMEFHKLSKACSEYWDDGIVIKLRHLLANCTN